MADYLRTIQISVLLFPLIGLVLMVPVWVLHRRWFGELHEYRAFVFFAFVFALVTAMLLTVLPLPKNADTYCEKRAGAPLTQVIPFESFVDIVEVADATPAGWRLPQLVKNHALWQVIFNFMMLMPVGFFLRALYGVKVRTALLVGFGITLGLELTQLTGIWGLAKCPYRVFAVDDLMTNTLGTAVGWWAVRFFRFFPDPKQPEVKN